MANRTGLSPARKRRDLNSAISDFFITKIPAMRHRLPTSLGAQ